MFNRKETTKKIIEFIRNYYKENNLKGAVIGISGGKDSATVAGLFTKALGKENVIGIWMPCHSKEEDYQNAKDLAQHFGFQLLEYDLTNIYDKYVNDFKNNTPKDFNLDTNLIDANINIKPRLRTLTLYYHAAYLTRKNKAPYIVAGTSNKCEIYVGYFTKGGDNISDIQVLADLTTDEVIQVGEEITVPDKIVHKIPDDGLSGKTDEEKLGVKYSDIKDVIETGGKNIEEEAKQKVYNLHNKNMHKFNIPTFKK